jgi:pyruvate dehydrogenase E2 component (dihydrolipoamide acetyltransferase)
MKEFILPELGENIESASVLNILVKQGDYLKQEQPVLEIETDKATIEVPSNVEGLIKDLFIKEGDKVKVGQVILRVEESQATEKPQQVKEKEIPQVELNAETKKEIASKPQQIQTSGGIVEFIIPDLGENIQSADILKVLVKVGDVIQKEDGVLEIETDKATIEVPSTVSGKVLEVFIKEGDKAKVGQVALRVESVLSSEVAVQQDQIPQEKIVETQQTPIVETPAKVEVAKVNPVLQRAGLIDTQPAILPHSAPAAPSVRRLARELGVDINGIPGSGINGRISLDDVKAYVKRLNENRSSFSGSSIGIKTESLPDFSKFGNVERKPMSNIRSKTADHLSYAWATIPHVTQFDKADITDLEKVRKGLASSAEKEGTKLTVTSFLLRIISEALTEFPQFNSSIDMERKEIIYKNFVNIGVAVDTENGLIVPVVKNVKDKNIFQLSKDMNELADKARRRKIGLEDLQGGCFTISNLGGIGGTYFTPIVNSPEVAILGVSRGSFEPVYKDGQFIPRLMLPLSLSYDHRIIDGADAIRFLRWIIEALENPYRFLL